jgi:hypothetical protein
VIFLNWVDPQNIIISYYVKNNYDPKLIENEGKTIKTDTLVSFGNFAIVYRVIKARAEKEAKKFGVEDATVIHFYLSDRFLNIANLDSFMQVLPYDSDFESTIKELQSKWEDMILNEIDSKIDRYKKGFPLIPHLDFKKNVKRKMKEYEFFIKLIFPEKYKEIPSEIFK